MRGRGLRIAAFRTTFALIVLADVTRVARSTLRDGQCVQLPGGTAVLPPRVRGECEERGRGGGRRGGAAAQGVSDGGAEPGQAGGGHYALRQPARTRPHPHRTHALHLHLERAVARQLQHTGHRGVSVTAVAQYVCVCECEYVYVCECPCV